MSLTDPLIILRQAIKSKSPISYANGDEPSPSLASATNIVFSPTSTLPKSTPTRYRKPDVSTSTEPASNPQDFFSIEAIYLAWVLRDAPGAEYMRQARENGLAVGFVSVTERKSVVDWLEGNAMTHERIVPLTCKFSFSHTQSESPSSTPSSRVNHTTRNSSTNGQRFLGTFVVTTQVRSRRVWYNTVKTAVRRRCAGC
jgi:parafibromin